MLAGQLISWLAGLQIPKSFLFKYELNIIVYNFFILMIQIVVSLQKYFPQCWSDKGFKVNRALSSLNGGSLKITLTVPLNNLFV